MKARWFLSLLLHFSSSNADNSTYSPTALTPTITLSPTQVPFLTPSHSPTSPITQSPSLGPTSATLSPTYFPATLSPTYFPATLSPTYFPTNSPTSKPTVSPTYVPTSAPTLRPTVSPTYFPTQLPTIGPTVYVTPVPTHVPTSLTPTGMPTTAPTLTPFPTRAPTTASPSTRSPSPAGFAYPCPNSDFGGPNCNIPLTKFVSIPPDANYLDNRQSLVGDYHHMIQKPQLVFQAKNNNTSVGNWSYWEFKVPKIGGVPAEGRREEYQKYFRITQNGGSPASDWRFLARRVCIHSQSTHCRATHVFPHGTYDNIINVSGYMPLRAHVSPRTGMNVIQPVGVYWQYLANKNLSYGCGCESIGTNNQPLDYEEVWYFAVQHKLATPAVTFTVELESMCGGSAVYLTNTTLPTCQCNYFTLGARCNVFSEQVSGVCCTERMSLLPSVNYLAPRGNNSITVGNYPGSETATYFLLNMPQAKTYGTFEVSFSITAESGSSIPYGQGQAAFQIIGVLSCSNNCTQLQPGGRLEQLWVTYQQPKAGKEEGPGCDCSRTDLGNNRESLWMKITHAGYNRSMVKLQYSWEPRCSPLEHSFWNESASPCRCVCEAGWSRPPTVYAPNCNPCSVQESITGGGGNSSGSGVQVSQHTLEPSTTLVLTFNVPKELVPQNDFAFAFYGTPSCMNVIWTLFHDCSYPDFPRSYGWQPLQLVDERKSEKFQNYSFSANYRQNEANVRAVVTRDTCYSFPGGREERYQMGFGGYALTTPCVFNFAIEITPACNARCVPGLSQCVKLPQRVWPAGAIGTGDKPGYNASISACSCLEGRGGFDCKSEIVSDQRLSDEERTPELQMREKYHGSFRINFVKGNPVFSRLLTSSTNNRVTISVSVKFPDVPAIATTYPQLPLARLHIWASYEDTLEPPRMINYNYAFTQTGIYRFALNDKPPPGTFAASTANILNGSITTTLVVPVSAGDLYIVAWFDNLGAQYFSGVLNSRDIAGTMNVVIEDSTGEVIGYVLLALSIALILGLLFNLVRHIRAEGVTQGIFSFLHITGIGGGTFGITTTTTNADGTVSKSPWANPTKYMIYFLAVVQVFLDIGGALSILAFNIAILHKQLSIVIDLPLMTQLLHELEAALAGMSWIIVPLTRFLKDLLSAVELKNTLKWNCGGALATITPLLLLICAFILMFIIQKNIVFRVAITLQGKGGFARKAAARFLQTLFLSMIQSVLILVLVLINFRSEATMFCGESDRRLLESMSAFTLVVVIVILPPIFMVFGMVANDSNSLVNVFWAAGRIVFLTFGFWHTKMVESFDIPDVAEAFDNDPLDDDNQQEAVMLLFAQTRCLLWCLIPGGLVATKLAEAANSNIVFVNPAAAELKLKRPLFKRFVGWLMCIIQFALTLSFVGNNSQTTAVWLIVLTIFMPIVHVIMGENFIATVRGKVLALQAARSSAAPTVPSATAPTVPGATAPTTAPAASPGGIPGGIPLV